MIELDAARQIDCLVLWDFDGTLAYRPGMWSGCLMETLDEHAPGDEVDAEQLRSLLRDGFPWHHPEVAHPELDEPCEWWRCVEQLLARAYEGVGFAALRADELAGLARRRFVDPSHGWRLYDDTLPVLGQLREDGWRHAILSNHVPELPALVAGLELSELIEVVFTSATTGYEKPNPAAFRQALVACGRPERVWMIGDNPLADVVGAEAVGIPAVLVRGDSAAGAARYAEDLHGVVPFVLGSQP